MTLRLLRKMRADLTDMRREMASKGDLGLLRDEI